MISEDWRLISLGKGYFHIILKSLRHKKKVWGLDSINLKPGVLCLQPWVLDFNPSLQKSTNAQVWVRFYDLSWEYWHPNIIFYLAKGIGVPLRLDKATIDGDFRHYARVLVDVDMSTLLPSSVLLEKDEIHSSFISVEYENLPSFCSICSSIGHLPCSCRWNKSKVPTANIGKSSQLMVEGSPSSSVVISSGPPIMDTIFLGVHSQSLGVGVLVASSGPTIQDDKLLSDSQAELRFIVDSS
ncbi:hypothetical protein Ddye_000869 [Dipteronia dyeriana]|uniref:DUF4283 domain-containing protein n=1 Tax=Dipteronia dyeriana TaxID=168575 RepID=A0AAD9XMS1_9ROSI|nr:hypothetical protein Ddye_000869 [Dipteronia dyeriana]